MATELLLPQWGMEMKDGTVVRWLKSEGDEVAEGEPIVEIETAKLATEMEATVSGVLARILVPEGATVPILSVLAVIAAPGEEVSRPSGPAPVAEPPESGSLNLAAPDAIGPGSQASPQVIPAARRLARQRGLDLAQVRGTGPSGRILLADVEASLAPEATSPADRLEVQVVPAARRLAKQHGADLSRVRGTGPRGRILIQDVEAAIAIPAAPSTSVVPITGIRRTIATRMLQSTVGMAQVTLTTEADVTEAMMLREGLSRQLTEGGLSPLVLVIAATARALGQHPRMNALQTEEAVELAEEVNVGLAVALEEGLIVPVIRRADEKNLAQIAAESRDLGSRSREGHLAPDDVLGGTFTVTNLGSHEIDAFTPIINPPQVGILGVGRVVQKPAVHRDEIVKRHMMFLSLTFDHRVIDGAPAADFLRTVKVHLEDPWWMVVPA